MRRVAALTVSFAMLFVAQGVTVASADTPAGHVATIQTADGQYRAVIRDSEALAKARAELAGKGDAGVPTGPLDWGSGGINKGHRWHVSELSFADFTIELCDGTVRHVDADPAYWIRNVGYFCPWSGSVVSLEPLPPSHRSTSR